MKDLLLLLVPLTLLAASGVWRIWGRRHSRELIDRWAKRNGFTIERAETELLGPHPFAGYARGQAVWAVRLRRANGDLQDVWLRCGGTALGYHLDDVEVRWVDPGKSAFL